MNNSKTTARPTAELTQPSPLPDVIVRLDEIRRRPVRSRTKCASETQRNLIALAEHEVFRSLQLLEAEVRRMDVSPASTGSP